MSDHEDPEPWGSDPTVRTAIRNILDRGGDDLAVVDMRGVELFRIKPTTLVRLVPFLRFTMTRRSRGVRAHWAANGATDARKEVRPESVVTGAGDQTGLRALSVEANRDDRSGDPRSALNAGSPGLGRR